MGKFTKNFGETVDCIVTPCKVYPGVDVEHGEKVTCVVKTDRAMWDTGATQSLVSLSVVERLGVKPYGKVPVESHTGEIEWKNTYHVHLGLPTGDAVLDVEAMEDNGESYDVVIGMDVIAKGDFAFTNKDGKSVFSFRIPSEETIVF